MHLNQSGNVGGGGEILAVVYGIHRYMHICDFQGPPRTPGTPLMVSLLPILFPFSNSREDHFRGIPGKSLWVPGSHHPLI